MHCEGRRVTVQTENKALGERERNTISKTMLDISPGFEWLHIYVFLHLVLGVAYFLWLHTMMQPEIGRIVRLT